MAVERPVFTLPAWHRQESAEQIQARMMERLPPDIDNIEGGFPYDFTMPTALEEDELMNFVLIETLKIMFPAWAYGIYLDYHAAAVGLTRRPANHAGGYVTITGVPGTEIPVGTIFCVPAVNDVPAIEYATITDAVIGEPAEGDEYGTVDIGVTAVVGGRSGNVSADSIVIMASPFKGVVSVTNQAAITGGTVEESDDELYERIVFAEQSPESFVGNDADYIRWAKEVNGVGTVLIDTQYEVEHPNWVKLIILDANGQPANDQILAAVYDVRNVRRKIRPSEHNVNSPWNIAADFDVDMGLSKEGIAGMLKEYDEDHATGMDTQEMAAMLYDYTSGYPFLVSRLCQLIDEKVQEKEEIGGRLTAWTKKGSMRRYA